MRRLVLLMIGVVAITMVGCTKTLHISFIDKSPVTPEHIDDLVAEEEYGEALELLNDMPETHPQYALLQKKRASVKRRAADYEKSVLQQMQTMIEKGEWSDALDAVNTGLDKLPSSAVLKQGREELLRKRAQRIDALERELLIAKGQWLIEDAPRREELARAASGNLISKWKLSRARSEVEETAEELYQCAQRATHDDQLDQARTCLSLAERLDPSDTMKAAIRELSQQITKREAEMQREEREKLTRQAQEAMDKGQLRRGEKMVSQLVKIAPDDPEVRELERRMKSLKEGAHNKKILRDYEQLAKQAKEAMEKGDLHTAQKIVPKLAKIDPDNPEVHQLQQRLDETVAETVNTMLVRGSRLYREEKIKEAKQVWEAVLELDPSNTQAREGVERAKRILKKLRVLEQKNRPPQEAFP